MSPKKKRKKANQHTALLKILSKFHPTRIITWKYSQSHFKTLWCCNCGHNIKNYRQKYLCVYVPVQGLKAQCRVEMKIQMWIQIHTSTYRISLSLAIQNKQNIKPPFLLFCRAETSFCCSCHDWLGKELKSLEQNKTWIKLPNSSEEHWPVFRNRHKK